MTSDQLHASGLTRRDFVARNAALAAALSIPGVSGCNRGDAPLDTALRTADWLFAHRQETDDGVVWPVDSAQPDGVQYNLYSGTPGVVLFLTELFDVTQDQRFLDEARRGADALVALLGADHSEGNGLYVGLGGIGFVLNELGRASGESMYRDRARDAFADVIQRAQPVGRGVAWYQGSSDNPMEITDIVSGASGTVLSLLYAHEQLDVDGALDTAVSAGNRLVELGQYADTGQRWAMEASFPRMMPNFSHGTAGVAYTLARLYETTEQPDFLASAVNGAWFLQTIMTRDDDDGWRIYHHDPDGEDLFYLSWCHGPVGTARLFHQLAKVTDDDVWRQFVQHGARGILNTGIPEERTPGFWNNVSQCCGTCGVGEFFMTLQALTPRPEYQDLVDRSTRDLAGRATEDETGTRWVQAEHRVQPELLQAQTGLMQGAAGMGIYYLHLHGLEHAGTPRITLPDSPFT